MKKFSLLEGFKYSDDEIEDFFIEYIDAKQFSVKRFHGREHSQNGPIPSHH